MDLRGRLSNPGSREIVELAARTIDGVEVGGNEVASPGPAPRRWRLVDRLGARIMHDLLHDSCSGATNQELADHYGIGLSSVKRLLKRVRET